MAQRRTASDEELRVKLEAAAPLLEDTRTRYRALVPALLAWGWRDRLRAIADVAREVARSDGAVVQALQRARRRAEVEKWPAGQVPTLLEDVASQRERLHRAVERRLERAAPPAEGLVALLAQVVGVPRKVPLGQREGAAQEALTTHDGVVPALHRFGAALEAVFARPLVRGQRLPFSLAEYDALLAGWLEGARALAQAWAQVARIDTTGGVESELRRRAKRAPKGNRGAPGPRALVHATFWRAAAEAHVEAVLAERFVPIQLSQSEHAAALRWLLARELDGAARLEVSVPLPRAGLSSDSASAAPPSERETLSSGDGDLEARRALLMLAHELTASPVGRAPLTGGRTQVRVWAAQADRLEGNDDWRRLRDGLRALSGRSFRSGLAPLYRVGQRTERTAVPERLTDFFSREE